MAKISLYPGVESDPAILSGKPVIAGTRVPVTLILGQLGGGVTDEEIMREYHVTADQIHAALNYAASLINGETIYATVA